MERIKTIPEIPAAEHQMRSRGPKKGTHAPLREGLGLKATRTQPKSEEDYESDSVDKRREDEDQVPDLANLDQIETSLQDDLRELDEATRHPNRFRQLTPKNFGVNKGIDDSDTNALRIYLRDIAATPLLTAQEEITLAKLYREGQNASEQLLQPPNQDNLGSETLKSKAEAGEAARKHMVEANLRLVVAVARKYSGSGVALLDLIQEGNIGLMKAVEKFDHTKGFRFSTYAYWWIRQTIARAIADQVRTVRVPVHAGDAIKRMRRVMRELNPDGNLEPSVESIAEAMGTTKEYVEVLIRAQLKPLSMDLMVGDMEDDTLGNVIADPNPTDPQNESEHLLLKRALGADLVGLGEKHALVLSLRFGLNGGREHTLADIGDYLGVSRERVRQLQAEALNKLRRPDLRSRYKEYL